MFFFIYKNYKECVSASFISIGGSFFLLMSILMFFGMASLGSFDWLSLGIFLVLGISGVWYAPRHAKKKLMERVAEDVEYACYIAKEYPQYKSLVKSFQPLYHDEDEVAQDCGTE